MIHLRISSRIESKIERIAELLLREKLAIDINIDRGIERWVYENEEITRVRVCLLTAKTKALLFPQLDDRLKEEFPENLPEIYSLPIVNMDWDQAKKLTEVIKMV